MMHDDFLSFMRSVVLPRKEANLEGIRLDGERSGGSREVVGKFRHHDVVWTVHADTHYEPLILAYRQLAELGVDPFIEDDTPKGRCLALTAKLRASQKSDYKHMYIYAW